MLWNLSSPHRGRRGTVKEIDRERGRLDCPNGDQVRRIQQNRFLLYDHARPFRRPFPESYTQPCCPFPDAHHAGTYFLAKDHFVIIYAEWLCYAANEIERRTIMKRCEWANRSELEAAYHDNEWGVPVHDDRSLFEFLILEGAQAGLSWSTILRKREGYRKAFDNFDARKISQYSENDVSRLLVNPEIIRNKLKIHSTITNARAFLQAQEQFGGFDHYIWQFVHGRPIQSSWKKMSDIPSSTPESEDMSKDLQKRGFKFVGTTICYAFMQAVGMVNDHVVDCFRYAELKNVDKRRGTLDRR